MKIRASEFISKAEGLKQSEINVRRQLEQIKAERQMIQSAIETQEYRLESLYSELESLERNNEDGDNSSRIASVMVSISSVKETIFEYRQQDSRLSISEAENNSELQRIEHQEQETLADIQDSAARTSQNISLLSSFGGDYGNVSAQATSSFNHNLDQFSQAAQILGGSINSLGVTHNGSYPSNRTISKQQFSVPSKRNFYEEANNQRNIASKKGSFGSRGTKNQNSKPDEKELFRFRLNCEEIESKKKKGKLGGKPKHLYDNQITNASVSNSNQSDKNKQYTSVDELNDDLYDSANDYVENHSDYNTALREHRTNSKIEHFRDIINDHQISKDMVVFRRATRADLGGVLSNIPAEELSGKCYTFEGIMSTGSRKMADTVSHGNVIFEFRVDEGTPGLDLLKVPLFQEAMFDSPFCQIESAKNEDNGDLHIVARILSAGNELNRVDDFPSLSKYMASKYAIQLHSSIEGLDFNTVKSAIIGVESVIKEYPDVGKYLTTGLVSNSGVMSCTGSKLSFNPDYFCDDTKLSQTCKDMSDVSFWVKNASVASIGKHEAGHGVEWAIILANTNYTNEYERVQAWNNCTEARKIVLAACSNIKNTEYGRGKRMTELVSAISTYALESDSETMAEAFADVYANGDNANPLSKEIKRLTKLTYDTYKGGK